LRLTADDQIVVFHDADAWRMCASPMKIGESTLAELSRLRLGGQPIPTWQACWPWLRARALAARGQGRPDIWRWIPALRRELAGYSGRFGVMSFDPRVGRLLKTNMPDVRRGLILRAEPLRSAAAGHCSADPQFLAVERLRSAIVGQRGLRRECRVYAGPSALRGTRASAVQADALIWEVDGRP
jgi:glycerophosphoryl diester phosphodiesterase